MLSRLLLVATCVAAVAVAAAATAAGSKCCPPVVSRADWGARAARSRKALLVSPAPYAIVHHSADGSGCHSRAQCCAQVRAAQKWHMKEKWIDIGYNFLVGEDGAAYEGRGWGAQGSHAPGYNSKSLGVCVLGNFTKCEPNQAALRVLQQLLECAVSNGRLTPDYKLIGHRQIKATTCPGDRLYDWVKRQPRWACWP